MTTTTTTTVPVPDHPTPRPKPPKRARRKTAAAKAREVEPLVYRKAEVCRALKINKSTLERMVHRGEFPAADVRLGRAIGWRVSTVLAWLDDPAAFKAGKGGRA